MTAVDLKALPWQHIDPSSVSLGPEMKFKKNLIRVKHVQFLHTLKLHFFCPLFAKTHLDIMVLMRKSCCQLKRVITGLPLLAFLDVMSQLIQK